MQNLKPIQQSGNVRSVFANLELAQPDKLTNAGAAGSEAMPCWIRAEVETIDRKLQAKSVRKVLRDVFGKTKHDSTQHEGLAASLRSMEQRENDQKNKLEREISLETKRHNDRLDGLRSKANTSIERRQKQLRDRAKAERSATPTTAPFVDRAKTATSDFKQANDNAPKVENRARTEARTEIRTPAPEKSNKPSQREDLATKKPTKRMSLDERKWIASEQSKDVPKQNRKNEPS